MSVQVFEGDGVNLKITVETDLQCFGFEHEFGSHQMKLISLSKASEELLVYWQTQMFKGFTVVALALKIVHQPPEALSWADEPKLTEMFFRIRLERIMLMPGRWKHVLIDFSDY